MKYKKCGRCKNTLPLNLEYFYKKGDYFSNRCKMCSKIENKANYKKHKDKHLSQKKEYWKKNKEVITKYREDNKDALNATRRLRIRKLRKDPLERFKKNITESIRRSLKSKGIIKSKKSETIIGCSKDILMEKLIMTFEDNYKIPWRDVYFKYVHIDHIIPINIAKSEEEVLELNHHSNLQFLYFRDNILKSDNVDWELNLYETEFYETCLGVK